MVRCLGLSRDGPQRPAQGRTGAGTALVGRTLLLYSLFSQPVFPKVLLSLPKGFEPALEAGAGIGTRERVFFSFQCECILLPPGMLEA